MKYYKKVGILSLFLLVLFLVSYAESEPLKWKGPRGKLGKMPIREYVYEPKGKIDPFFPFILKKEEGVSEEMLAGLTPTEKIKKALNILKEMKKAKTELQTIPLSKLELSSILNNGKQYIAMVREKGKDKGYIIKKGTPIGTRGGVVEDIISIEKETELGKQLIRKIIIKVPYIGSEGDIKFKRVEMSMPGTTVYQ